MACYRAQGRRPLRPGPFDAKPIPAITDDSDAGRGFFRFRPWRSSVCSAPRIPAVSLPGIAGGNELILPPLFPRAAFARPDHELPQVVEYSWWEIEELQWDSNYNFGSRDSALIRWRAVLRTGVDFIALVYSKNLRFYEGVSP